MFLLLQVDADLPAVTSTDLVVMAAVVVAAFLVTRFIRPLIRGLLTWLARRSVAGRGARWRVRTPRVFGETIEQAELRRVQRISATAAGLSRILSAVVWIIAGLAVLERAEIDPVFALSGAGFLGVGIAVGGQHSVNDFITGLHILLEDRFGEGDQLRIMFNDEQLVLTVSHLGAFATRLEDGAATFYVPNRELSTVTNLSQRGATTEFEFEPTAEVAEPNPRSHVEAAVRARTAGSLSDDQRDALTRPD